MTIIISDCRAVICRTLTEEQSNIIISSTTGRSPSPVPNNFQTNDINNSNLSPNKRTIKTRSSSDNNNQNESSPKKRSKSEDIQSDNPVIFTPPNQPLVLFPQPLPQPRRGLIVRDFHLEYVVTLQPKSYTNKSFPEAPPLVSLTSEDQQLRQQQQQQQQQLQS